MASNSKARFSQCEVYPTAEENLKSVIKHGRTVTRMLKKNLLDVGRRGFAHQGDGPSNTSRSTFKFYSFVILWYINISRANIEIWKGVEFSWRRRRQQQRSQQKRAPRKSRRFMRRRRPRRLLPLPLFVKCGFQIYDCLPCHRSVPISVPR